MTSERPIDDSTPHMTRRMLFAATAGAATLLAVGRKAEAQTTPSSSTKGSPTMLQDTPFFTPKNAALILIDHQIGTMQLVKNIPLEVVKRNALALAKVAKILDMPVVLTSSQEDQFQGPLLPEFSTIVPNAYAVRVQRTGIVNAWDDRNFVAAVEKTGRKLLLMAGVTTDICLVFPAISAVRAGYGVQAVIDAGGSPFELSENMARSRMERAGVSLTATNTAIAELTFDWSLPAASKVREILHGDVMAEVLPHRK